MANRVLLVGNPTAQSGKAEARIQVALASLADHGLTADLMHTEPEGRTVESLRHRLDQPGSAIEIVVSLGGDGTFAEVAKGILAAKRLRKMGMLPSGTANNQGGSFGLSSDRTQIPDNVDVIQADHITHLDVGLVERLDEQGCATHQDLFFDCVGWGFSADVLQQRNRSRAFVQRIPLLREVYRDQALYAGAAIRKVMESWLEPTKFSALVVSNDVHHRLTALTDLIINNTPLYAGEWVLDRDTVPDDGRMELVQVKGRREMLSKVLRDFAHVPIWQEHLDALGVHHSEGFSAGSFELHFSRPGRFEVPSQLDGEEWVAGDHFRVQVQENRLPLLTPPEFVPPWTRS
jgi:diacylglycerol kinase family enzyme